MGGYEYESLPTNRIRKVPKRHYVWAVAAALGLLAIVNVCILRSLRRPPNLLDAFTLLNTGSAVHGGSDVDHESIVNSTSFGIPAVEERAVVSTLYSESYVNAVLTLGHSLRAAEVKARRVLLYFPERLSSQTICQLHANGWELHAVSRIAPPDGGRGVYYRFLDNYSKLQLWTLDMIGIKSVVYLDADTLVRRNFDELWTLPFEFAAVPDVYGDKRGFALSFNAGMMFLRPSSAVYEDMLGKIESDSYKHNEAEQGFLNMYFASQVVRLPYIYNANLVIKQRNPTLWKAIERDTRIIHYTMVKPFIEEENERARGGLWQEEFDLWETAKHDAERVLEGRC